MVYKDSQEKTGHRDRLESPDLPDCQAWMEDLDCQDQSECLDLPDCRVEMDFKEKKENEDSMEKKEIKAHKVKKEAKVLQVILVGTGYQDQLECPVLPDCQVGTDFLVKKENVESLEKREKREIQGHMVKWEPKVL